jgi:CxxC motif-containing protein (DUF1111 family)
MLTNLSSVIRDSRKPADAAARGTLVAPALMALFALSFSAFGFSLQALRAAEFRRGDANVDGRMDVSDAVTTLVFLFVESLALPCADAVDTDDNGSIEVTDAIALLGYLFRGQSQPPPPGAGHLCGEDPTDDDALTCVVYDACPQVYEPLFDSSTPLEPVIIEDTPTALVTHIADRVRGRHAREDMFQQYDLYLQLYFQERTFAIEIVDRVAKGGSDITVNITSLTPMSGPNFRAFFRGINTVAEYYVNTIAREVGPNQYSSTLTSNPKEGRALRVGDRMEFELGVFLTAPMNGRTSYYGTAFLYVVGRGVVPWRGEGERLDSVPLPEMAWLGGETTLPYQYSDEPDKQFMQMPTNLSSINGQTFVLGRRVHHTDFGDGSHSEGQGNPAFSELADRLGTNYINRSCISCHARNGRALPPATGVSLDDFVVKVGDEDGNPHPHLGSVLQPQSTGGSREGGVSISSWTESDGLRTPQYDFAGVTPDRYSVRIAPQLVGLGLLEAIPEAAIAAMADPDDDDGDGISGRIRAVTDPETGQARVGRFGWKAGQATVRHQVAAALNTDMGVMTSVYPNPDCGTSQEGCGDAGGEVSDEHLNELATYISLLGVHARRDLDDPVTSRGQSLFSDAGCESCHTPTLQTTEYHPHAELRSQTVHPYTDLLLHDMGSGLADNLAEGDAAGAEWRTAPLWGIGLTEDVSGGEAYLHDGRARSLSEAIRWHGGEAESARQAFEKLSVGDQDAMVTFLRSL